MADRRRSPSSAAHFGRSPAPLSGGGGLRGLSLTAREVEVMAWICDGKSDWQIGRILAISAKTVNFHVENVKRKCGVATRMQAVVSAIEHGALKR